MSRDKTPSETDPKGLIRESYRIDGISSPECRSIFLDWALSFAVGCDPKPLIEALLVQYGEAFPDHPMTDVLRQGLVSIQPAKRRGGWRSRPRN